MLYPLYSQLIKNYELLCNQVKQIRSTKLPQIMIVSKYVSLEELFVHLYNGCTIIGENYVQGAQDKYLTLSLLIVLIYTDQLLPFIKLLQDSSFNSELVKNNLLALAKYLNKQISDLDNKGQSHLDIRMERLIKNLSSCSVENLYHNLHQLNFIIHYSQQLNSQTIQKQLLNNLLNLEWHILGYLQSRKIKDVVKFATHLDSVSNSKTLHKLEKELSTINRKMNILIQLSPFATENNPLRNGCTEEEVFALYKYCTDNCPHLIIKGLMFVASTENRPEEYARAEQVFIKLQKLNPDMIDTFSAGMSDSIEIALKHNSTCIRIGSLLFKKEI